MHSNPVLYLPVVSFIACISRSTVFTVAQSVESQVLNTPLPYYFPNENLESSPGLFPMEQCNGITLEEATIDQMQDYMSHGKLTSSQLVMCYLQRIYQTNTYVKLALFRFFYENSPCNGKRQQLAEKD